MTNPNEYPLFMRIVKKKSDYEWNSEFIKLINQKVCPYCENSLIVKGILKQCKCSFRLLGAAETLAYSKISEKAPKHDYNYNNSTTFVCDECGCSDLEKDKSRAELICKECGLVINGPPSYSSYIKISYDSFKGGL